MPFLSRFHPDLYISFSEIDNASAIPNQQGWISKFQRALTLRLAQLFGTVASILPTDDAQNNNGGLHSAGILVSIVSPSYVSSPTCLRDIDQFIESASRNGGVQVEGKSRLFKVTKIPVGQEKQPPSILSLLNYEFYHVNGSSGRARELAQEGNAELVQNYWLKIDDLAYEIQHVLEMLKERGSSEPNHPSGNGEPDNKPPGQSATAKEKRVFISYAGKDEAKALEICTLLEAQGIVCWIAVRDAPPGLEYAPEISDALDDAPALVLILSNNSNTSVHVPHEVGWATSCGKPVFTVRIEDVQPSKKLALHIQSRSWLKAWDPPLIEKINRLASSIKKEIKTEIESDAPIYLAETSLSLRDERDSIRRELTDRGYSVLPDSLLPTDAESFKSAVREYLKRCRLSIHLVGENYGDSPKGETKSLIHLQNELALERDGDSGFSQLIWIPPGVDGQDTEQRKFIEGLRRFSSSHRRFELLQNSLEELKSYIEEALTSRRPPPPAASPGRAFHIYLICDQQDLPSVLPIKDYLYEEGYEVVLPIMTGNEADVHKDYIENLVHCDGCLIYYGAANEFWLRQKLRDVVQKSIGYGRTIPMLARAVYLASPDTLHKTNFRTLDAMVIQNFEAFDPDLLRPFLAAFAQAQSMGGGRQ